MDWKTSFVALLGLASFIGAQDVTPYIVVDQFGYRPAAVKTAVIRDPQMGSDSLQSFSPGAEYRVIDVASGNSVLSGEPVSFAKGGVDAASGDKVWWFDFSTLKTPGEYYVLDVTNNVKTANFRIAEDIYNDILKQAVRMLFYQRAGGEKAASYAGDGWADKASHLGTQQDANARLYNKKSDASTERDLRGGWYDAGDFNKYTSWAANYVEALLQSFMDRPAAFTDDYNIPESGNGVPDIIDEAKWGMDWLLRMQNEDGSCLSIVGLASGSPPSAATGKSYYGPANAIATIASTKAFALGATTFLRLGDTTYANKLSAAALKAWAWANAHPDSLFHNNSTDPLYASKGLGAGDQESEQSDTRLEYFATAGLYLAELTGDTTYLSAFEDHYQELPLLAWGNVMDQYRHGQHLLYLRYLSFSRGSSTIKADLQKSLAEGWAAPSDFGAKVGADGYRSFIRDYNWGSNKYKADYGLLFDLWAESSLGSAKAGEYRAAAEDYLHYIHGVNPLGLSYLTNMRAFGADKEITEIYHMWFADGSAKWDKTGASTFGPAPGYLAGGANSSYTWDACCDKNSCGVGNNEKCLLESVPKGEPAAKMYKDFNTSWPLNSLALTEPSNGYQVSYIRLLSRFVQEKGNPLPIAPSKRGHGLSVWSVRQVGDAFEIGGAEKAERIEIFDLASRKVAQAQGGRATVRLDMSAQPAGIYFVQARGAGSVQAAQRVIFTRE